MEKLFPVTRIFADENGDSRFQDITVSMFEGGTIGVLSEIVDVKGLVFREVEPSYNYDFHNAPNKQYLVLLDGEIEIETSLHEVRRFKAGEVLLLEDTTGKGHRTKNIVAARRKSLFILI